DKKGGVKPSNLNHGNVIFPKQGSQLLGGIRCRFAEQTTVVSLGALRKLRFPINGANDPARDDAGRTVLAAIALCAGVLATERGLSLRSRCNLRPAAPRVWELLSTPGEALRNYTITGQQAIDLLKEAIAAAESAGLNWMKEKLELKPSAELVELVRASQEKMAAEGDAEGA
ncbi:MAG TPA: type I-U CRISPR-associated protein Cas7, partial [Opitutaceae bacterium]|nr:type I-U CRISPR-associated protein Cas7 [Opitutaceae bacterium]